MNSVRLRCCWETWQGVPYFANLKLMRSVLKAVRERLEGAKVTLGAYVFLEHRVVWMVEGLLPGTEEALERAAAAAEEAFRHSDRKPLWGIRTCEVTEALPAELAAEALRLPVAAGVAGDGWDYPWFGGEWLFDRSRSREPSGEGG